MKLAPCLLAAVVAVATPASAELDLNGASVSHLPNGLTVIMLEDHSFPVVSVQALYKSGSAAEVTGKTGLAHFLEHLAFRGSANFPNGRATELIYDAGGEWHGYTAMDQTTYFATMPSDGLETLLRIEADRMSRTVIDPRSIQAEKGAVITELHSYENDPAGVLQDAVVRTALQSHPYGSPMAGYVSDVERLTIEDARSYYASHYAPGNAVLAIAGDFDPAQAKALVARAFSDVRARAVALPHYTAELPQRGERRIRLNGAVDRQYFQIAYPAPAASSPDFPAFLLLQQLLAGTPGLNPRQSGWSGTKAVEGSGLSGVTQDVATWLPATHDPFLFMISGSEDSKTEQGSIEREIGTRIARLQSLQPAQLDGAKKAASRILQEDVLTTEDAAHQLAFFEGIGALDALLAMPQLIQSVTIADLQRIAREYLSPNRATIGWMVPGNAAPASPGIDNSKPAADRSGLKATASQAGKPQLRHLAAGLPAIVQTSPLSDTATVDLLVSERAMGGSHPDELTGLDSIMKSGRPEDLAHLVSQAIAASKQGPEPPDEKSDDPETRLGQLFARQMVDQTAPVLRPLAVIVTGKVDIAETYAELERQLGTAVPGSLPKASSSRPQERKSLREHISKPLSQGAIGYIVEGPPPGTREAIAWRMLLYVFTHDYSGRLGRSAITEKGLVYHIYSTQRTDGRRTWATISTGVDPDKAEAMEVELRSELAKLAAYPPTTAELEAARSHLLGRDLTSAQSNDELAAKLARELVETGGPRSHEQLRDMLESITTGDLAKATKSFNRGTIIRVDVGG